MPNKLKIPQNPDISIIGGGMVGISLALLLSSYKLGWKIQIIDSCSLLAKSNTFLNILLYASISTLGILF